jgi:anti-anti-sigma regulatory factor
LEQFRLVLEGAQTIRTIDAACSDLVDAMAHHHDIVIDCSAATEVDVSLVQLLLAARASALRAGQQLALSQPVGEALRSTLVRGGFLADDPSRPGRDTAFWLGHEGCP